MKKFLYILLASLLIFPFTACDEYGQGGEEQSAMELDTVQETSATLMSADTFRLKAVLSGRGYTITLVFGTSDIVLPDGDYTMVNEVSDVGVCSLILNDGRTDLPVSSAVVTVSYSGDEYLLELYISGVYDYRFVYKGNLAFDLDLEPSENKIFVIESDVTTMNSWWQTVVVSGVMKYGVTVLNPDGETLALVEFISTPGKTLADLVGTYDVKTSSTSSGTVVGGAVNWGNGSGSWFMDKAGAVQYITGGKLTLSSFADAQGVEYYTIEGSGLTTLAASGSVGSGSFSLRNMLHEALSGTVERNHKIVSTTMNREMKYSIYLPESYDGVKEFPVLWLLHGYGDDQNSWLDKGFLHRFVNDYIAAGGREMIIVTPDGLTDFYMGAYENYFFKELMPEVESKFKVKKGREYRTVAGLSMGGHGSLYYGLKYNDMFCYAYAMSPACMFDVNQAIAGKNKADLPGITIETGIQDMTTNLQSVESIHNTLTSEGVDHDYITRDGGHDWTFWQEALPKALKKSGEVFAE